MYSLLVMGIFHCYVSLPERILIYSHLISGLKCPYLLQPLTLEACHSLDLGQIHARSGKITWRSLDNETYTVYIYIHVYIYVYLFIQKIHMFFFHGNLVLIYFNQVTLSLTHAKITSLAHACVTCTSDCSSGQYMYQQIQSFSASMTGMTSPAPLPSMHH